MARVFLTANFSNLSNWPGNLFSATAGTVVNTQTATTYAFTLPAGHDFAGYRIIATGSAFGYFGGTPVAGIMSQVRVLNASGQLVLTIDTLAPGSISSSLAQFASNCFGWTSPLGGSRDPDGWLAWSHLLSGNDVINGTLGDDHRGTEGMNVGNDTYNLFAGDDWVSGNAGNDTINGGIGTDGISFSQTTWADGATAFRGILVNVTAGTIIDCWGNTDRFTSVEEFEGSRFNDVFNGGVLRDRFTGMQGHDTMRGGADQDTVVYRNDAQQGGRFGIVVDLQTTVVNGSIVGRIRDGFGYSDTVVDIERVIGTIYNDTFVGSTQNNVFRGGEGRDSYAGDLGFDRVSFNDEFASSMTSGVIIDLRLTTNQVINDGFGNAETVINIEQFEASDGNDRLIGNVGNHSFVGGDGRDTMTGGGGADFFEFWDSGNFGDGDVITDFLATAVAGQTDRLGFDTTSFAGMTKTLTLVNGTAATAAVGTFIFDTTTDILYWDRDGTGAAAREYVVTLTNVVSLSAANFALW